MSRPCGRPPRGEREDDDSLQFKLAEPDPQPMHWSEAIAEMVRFVTVMGMIVGVAWAIAWVASK